MSGGCNFSKPSAQVLLAWMCAQSCPRTCKQHEPHETSFEPTLTSILQLFMWVDVPCMGRRDQRPHFGHFIIARACRCRLVQLLGRKMLVTRSTMALAINERLEWTINLGRRIPITFAPNTIWGSAFIIMTFCSQSTGSCSSKASSNTTSASGLLDSRYLADKDHGLSTSCYKQGSWPLICKSEP